MNIMLNLHEELFVRNFIISAKRDRYLSLLETAKGRRKLTGAFDHCSDLDMRYAKLIPANQQYVEAIEEMLKGSGAPDECHVMSSNPAMDNQNIALHTALSETVGQGAGTLISCIPGKLAYFEFGDVSERYILER